MNNTNPEIKQCQNCRNSFEIEAQDFAFYEKIKVPVPTFCPECRMIRRMLWRNERTLYKRKCDAPGHNEEIISIYDKNSPFKVYDQKYWWSDEWDAMSYGRDYDFNRSFFEQWKELLGKVPQNNLIASNNVNSDYVNLMVDSKNCYLIMGGKNNENVIYSNHIFKSISSSDLYFVDNIEFSYEDVICQNSYKLFFSQNCNNCSDSYFLYDCKNCQNCFGCANLRNKQYYIFNKPYSKEEYQDKLEGFDLGSFINLIKQKEIFQKFKLNYPRKFANLSKAYNTSGDNVTDAKNCKSVFDILAGGSEDCKFTFWAGQNMKDIYDGVGCGVNGERSYEVVTGAMSSRTYFITAIWSGHDIYYSFNCHSGCSYLFACIGLRNKQYCILNKQYTKEEYEKLVPKIIQHMKDMPYVDKKGRVYKYGEFFPPELSPFSYNETIAQEYFPLNKEQAIEKGYSWKDPEERDIKIDIKTEDLPDHIKDVKDDIIGKVIQCSHANLLTSDVNKLEMSCNEQCTTAFKIIEPELAFYRKMNLPLPRLCPNCRHYQRLKQRNPLKLWHRRCHCQGTYGVSESGIMNNESGIKYQNTIQHFHGDNPCPNEFETTYAPERQEIVYCDRCYQQEVV